jgi:hypothetical protein
MSGWLWEQLGEAPPVEEGDGELEASARELEAGPEDLKTCPDCGEQVKAAARKCRFCGYRFEPHDPEPDAHESDDVAAEPETTGM